MTLLFMIVFPFGAFACLVVWYWWAAPGVHRPFDLMMVSMTIILIAGLIVAGGALLAVLAAHVKRMHDRGKSGGWVAFFWIAPIALNVIGDYGPSFIDKPLALVASAIVLWAVIEMGFGGRTAGSNDVIPDPMAAAWGDYAGLIHLTPIAAAPVVRPVSHRSAD